MSKHIIRVGLIIIVYLLISIGLYITLLFFFPESTITSVGQLFADVLLFPIVIIGFWITFTEFRKSQVLPKIQLFWMGDIATDRDGDQVILEVAEYNSKRYYLSLFAQNSGAIMATWYRINFMVPHALSSPNSDTHKVRWHRGQSPDWNSSLNGEETIHEFKSNGQYALYPGETVHIATLEVYLFPQINYPKDIQIRYSIVSDRTQIEYGVCSLQIREENFARKIPQEWFLEDLLIREQPDASK
jgi:hypothetical protein